MTVVFPWMRPRRVRRTMVAAGAAFSLGLLGCGAALLWGGGRGWTYGGLGCGAGALAVSCLLAASGIPTRDSGELDERQRWAVVEARAHSFRLLTALLTAAVMGLFFIDLAELEPPPAGDWKVLLLAYVLIVPFLPTALIAWREPDGGTPAEKP